MRVIKRNGAEVEFDIVKIIAAVTKANDVVDEEARMTPVQIQRIAESVEIAVKYEGYIRRQMAEVAEFARLEHRAIPEDIDYAKIDGLRLEAREKLAAIRPQNLGQAGRISGVSPADVAALMLYITSKTWD